MSIMKKSIVLGLCLVLSAQTHTASRFYKVAKFITTPSMLLGASASAYKYKLQEEAIEDAIDSVRLVSKAQNLIFNNKYFDTLCYLVGYKNYKEKIEEITQTCSEHGVNPTIKLDRDRGSDFSIEHNNESIISINTASSSLERKFLTGHECTHIKSNDCRNRNMVKNLQPLIISSLYKGSQTLGASKKLSILCATSGLLSYPFIDAKIRQEQEYRCDRESSQDPEVIEAGAQFFDYVSYLQKNKSKDLKERCQVTVQDALKELHPKIKPYLLRDLNTEYQSLCNDPDSKPIERLAHYTVEAEELFADHPPSDLRAQRLWDQAQAIRKDREKKRIEAKYAYSSNSQ